jgi:hypothetical protein
MAWRLQLGGDARPQHDSAVPGIFPSGIPHCRCFETRHHDVVPLRGNDYGHGRGSRVVNNHSRTSSLIGGGRRILLLFRCLCIAKECPVKKLSRNKL